MWALIKCKHLLVHKISQQEIEYRRYKAEFRGSVTTVFTENVQKINDINWRRSVDGDAKLCRRPIPKSFDGADKLEHVGQLTTPADSVVHISGENGL